MFYFDLPLSKAVLLIIGPSIADSIWESSQSQERYEYWLMVWGQTIATELSQLFNCIDFIDPGCRKVEAGDCLRAVVAMCMINRIPIVQLMESQSYGANFDRFDVLNEAFGLVELVKTQTCPLNNAPVCDRMSIIRSLRVIFGYLADEVDLYVALELLSDRLI